MCTLENEVSLCVAESGARYAAQMEASKQPE